MAAALTIRRNYPRAADDLIERFRDAPTGWVVDANGRRGALDHRIRPITRVRRFSGTAITVHSRARDNLAPYAAIAFARPGDIMLIATDGYEEASVVGDILVGMAKNKGIAAIVTDGMVRDVEGLDAVGVPVFARGLSPNSPHKDGPGEIGLPITLGGASIDSGDLVVGDQDGVVVVARTVLESVATALAEVKEKEAKMDALVRNGATTPPWMEQTLREKGVRYLD
jgi:4-hydroxy-4-methyl-2-oxoglutarate aldolase